MAPPISKLTSTRYALVIDAGSSGSRLQIYSWQDPEAERQEIISTINDRWQRQEKLSQTKGKGKAGAKDELEWEIENALRRLVKVEKGAKGDQWIKKAEPGISTIEPESIDQYLAPLLTHALQQIPPSQHKNTPIYLLATAGMRLIPEQRQQDILEATCSLLKKDYPFRLDTKNEQGPCGESVRIISGEEEGMWGWVAVNYLMDGFGHMPHSSSSVHDHDPALLPLPKLEKEKQGSLETDIPPTLVDPNQHTPTFGFLDMGGASTQIAFSPTFEELKESGYPAEELKSVSLRLLSGQVVEWPVFVASWLGFGTNKARDRYVQLKLDEWKREEDDGGLSGSMDAIPDPCLPKGLSLPSSLFQTTPPFIGTGSFSQCLTSLQHLLEKEAPCPEPHGHCLFAGLPTPHINFGREEQRGFIGISEYWYTAQQVLGLGGVWDWGEWERGMNEFCRKDWTALESQIRSAGNWHDSQVDLARLQMQCFKGAWISNVLHEGIGIPRIFDAGGNQTLVNEETGDFNDEAERRAKEKGLMGKNHFQSMDSIGNTAISWTLGKMVIEASRGVDPHGYAPEQVGLNNHWTQAWHDGASRIGDALGVPVLDDKLATYGIELIWLLYLVVLAFVLSIYFSLRRRCWLSPGSISATRRRKQSDAGEIRDWMRRRSSAMPIATDDLTTPTVRQRPFGLNRFKLLGYRMVGLVDRLSSWKIRQLRSRPTKHDSEPAIGLLEISNTQNPSSYSMSSSLSLPATPHNGEAFFTPAHHVAHLATPTHKQSLALPSEPPSPSASGASSRHGGLSQKSSFSNLRAKRGHPVLPMLSAYANANAGWNDPPVSVLELSEARSSSEEGVLMPNLPHKGLETQAISRNSSRINLAEYGRLAPRPMSRGPGAEDM
ncbi:hypothetical protein QFC21_001372 [Naganishia friedmannii]|uniref:Uncharacterized protein n=1 Tax=Naganishia friedmannii TaxID=89922 RepID=A0ACC2W440_9TREE|nr:hypothetical protein QFC21_001372 [Naganishia friedmannii]